MIITPSGMEPVYKEKKSYEGTIEKAMSIGLEDAMKDKGRECDYQFTIEKKGNIKRVLCEIYLENGFLLPYEYDTTSPPDLKEIERKSYQFLLEKL